MRRRIVLQWFTLFQTDVERNTFMRPTFKTAFKWLGIAQIVVTIALIAGVFTFAGPCKHDDGSIAVCAQASWGIIGAGVFLLGTSLAQLVAETPTARILFAIACAAIGVFIILAPGVLMPLCTMETMSCQAVMKPFAQICGGATILISVITTVVAIRW